MNICAIKVVSQSDAIGNGSTALSCTGDDQSRLANCDEGAADDVLDAELPADFEVDWHAIVLNNDRWWNTGSAWMLWSGGHEDADGAARSTRAVTASIIWPTNTEVRTAAAAPSTSRSTRPPTARPPRKVGPLGGLQPGGRNWRHKGFFNGSRYCDSGQYRPSDNSMMNMLFGDDGNTAFNAVSREKIIMDIWGVVVPIDSTDPRKETSRARPRSP